MKKDIKRTAKTISLQELNQSKIGKQIEYEIERIIKAKRTNKKIDYDKIKNAITPEKKRSDIMNKEIGRILNKLRRENKYTQEQVSNYLGITQTNLSKIENGDKNFNMTLLDKLCLLYNCSPEYLLGETNFHEKTSIVFLSDEKVDLNVVAKMNEITRYLKLLRKLDEGDDKL